MTDGEQFGPDRPVEPGSDGPQVILVGVDGTPTSMRAGAYAAGLARRQGARLVVVFVAVPSRWTSISVPGAAFAQQQAAQELAAELRDQARRGAEDLGIPVLFRYRHGEPYHELCRVADEVRADLVVIGASAGLAHRVAPSTGSRLVKARRWPVVVVP